MSYHSYRNIGFVFTDTEANCIQWRSRFTGYDSSRARRFLHVSDGADGCLYITYLLGQYRLHPENGILEKQISAREAAAQQERDPSLICEDESGNLWTQALFMNEALVLYHILGDLQENPGLSGEWVPQESLDPVSFRSGNRTDPLLQGFASDFTGRLDALKTACQKAGGTALTEGDLAFVFYPFPETPMRLVFWDRDEDFPAQVQVYVDSRITQYMHFEAVGCMVADLFQLLGRLAGICAGEPFS